MKETSFIEQNKEKWDRFEKVYDGKNTDPEELSDLYMDITNDLSYAQTFYKRRSVRVYLNQLAQKVYSGVHKQNGESFKKFITIWKTSLPLEIYRSRKFLLFALVSFLVYAMIGVITTHFDPDFPRLILGDYYVDMTIENIQNGNPLKVYEDDHQLAMFIRITMNNLGVAFLCFFAGFLFTIGTHILLFSNGVMLGSFQYFFHTKGLLVTSFLGIWIHGAFEISAIVLAGGAGITAGSGLLFPKSYTRLQSLQLSTKRGLKIMMSLVPFIIAAGFLESYVTHNYQSLPDWSKWLLILLSFGLILFFYVFYPMYVARKHPELVDQEEVDNFKIQKDFNFHKTRNAIEEISDSFKIYRKILSNLLQFCFLPVIFPAIILIAIQDYNHYDLMLTEHWFDWSAQMEIMLGTKFSNLTDVLVFIGWTWIFTNIASATFWNIQHLNQRFSWKSFIEFYRTKAPGIWIGVSLVFALIVLIPYYLFVATILLLPLVYLIASVMGYSPGKFGEKFKKGFKYSTKHYLPSLANIFIAGLIIAVLMQPIALVFSIHEGYRNEPMISDLLDLACGFIKRVGQEYTEDYILYSNVFRQFIYLFYILITIPFVYIITSLSYFSQREKNELTGLKMEFKKFGKRSRTQETNID